MRCQVFWARDGSSFPKHPRSPHRGSSALAAVSFLACWSPVGASQTLSTKRTGTCRGSGLHGARAHCHGFSGDVFLCKKPLSESAVPPCFCCLLSLGFSDSHHRPDLDIHVPALPLSVAQAHSGAVSTWSRHGCKRRNRIPLLPRPVQARHPVPLSNGVAG